MLRKSPESGAYFQGLLQLRPANEEVLDFLEQESEQNPRFVVSFQRIVKRGEIDLYVTDQHVLVSVGKKLAARFPGVMKVTRKLHTRDRINNKNLYRVTVVFRPLGLKRGETYVYRGISYIVDHISKNQVTLKDAKSGKKHRVSFDEL